MAPPPDPRGPRALRGTRASRAPRPARARWSRRLLDALAAAGAGWRDGRGAVAPGAVGELRLRAGAVTARVQGERPRPYLVEVGVRRYGPAEVEALVAVLVENPLLIAPLADGDVPPVLADLLAEVGVDLLPAPGEVTSDCSCPDDGDGPCEHAAALAHALAGHLDAEPVALLALRGAAPAALLRRVEDAASGTSPAADDLDADPAAFHLLAAEPPELVPARRVPGRTVADDLDAVALGPGGEAVADALRPFYAALEAASGATGRAAGSPTPRSAPAHRRDP
ncbi:SWIM zinc finger family protein [Kineococcus sp. SYSU DK018]|uniref:SWIM zinc finger family protein n=1 Tax=Kineococcus sp. SYSU DK018 TaxID=3383139 RepID=UPI003D7CE92C